MQEEQLDLKQGSYVKQYVEPSDPDVDGVDKNNPGFSLSSWFFVLLCLCLYLRYSLCSCWLVLFMSQCFSFPLETFSKVSGLGPKVKL